MKGLTTILFLTVLTISCADVKNNAQLEELQAELDSLKNCLLYTSDAADE